MRLTRGITLSTSIWWDYYVSHYLWQRNGKKNEVHQRSAKKLKEYIVREKGIYIKYGQQIAQADYWLPEAYARELRVCFNAAPEDSFEQIKKLIEHQFGLPLDELFSSFSQQPIASASLAQVHEARLKNGERVAVKVQHPGLFELANADLVFLEAVCKICDYFAPEYRNAYFATLFRNIIKDELDFSKEAVNCRKCASFFQEDETVAVPQIHNHLTRQRVLTMSYEEGVSVANLQQLKDWGLDSKEVAKNISTAFSKLIFLHGYIHCDPHPGNIFVRPFKSKKGKLIPQIVILDHGFYTVLDEQTRKHYCHFWRGVLLQDEEMIKAHCKELGSGNYKLLTALFCTREYDDVLKESKEGHKHAQRDLTPQGREKVEKMFEQKYTEMMEVLEELKPEVMLILDCNEILFDLDRRLGSPLNTFELTAKYAREGVKEELKEQSVFKEFWFNLFLLLQKLMMWVGLM